MIKNLVIVESPAKARTISNFLGNDYKVLASFGHVRDLPKNKLGFDPKNNFEPEYIISNDKTKIVRELKSYINKDTVIYLASDEDREGESISWHLIHTLGITKNVYKRIVFHEITKPAILHAIENPVPLNINLVNAQQARRILDRAVGYKLSPLLWKKIKFGLSAGRVQSAAVKIIVDRENEINEFIPEEFWKLKLDILSNPSFKAELSKIDNKVTKVKNKEEADTIINNCKGSDYLLDSVEEKESTRFPSAPFTTSTLQQVASSKAGFAVKTTMLIAQKLYEGSISIPGHSGGLITYMRTDSLNLSDVATSTAKEVITKEYGSEYALEQPRKFTTKAKGAQEAHEAIRPVNMKLKPSDIAEYLDSKELKLYTLIWSRTMASQMKPAIVSNTTYKIKGGNEKQYEFVAKGTKILFPGYMKAYDVGNNDTDENNDTDDEKFLPNVPEGTIFNNTNLIAEQNFTKPPSRYNEAGLVKKLEAEGVGRPSTYASTISTIITRGYVEINKDKKLVPTIIGIAVTKYLVEHFNNIVDVKFTAGIENEFDKIANGEIEWQTVMHNFYDDFVKNVDAKEGTERVQYSEAKLLGEDPTTKLPVSIKVGQYGTFVQLGIKEEGNTFKPKVASVPKGKVLEEVTLEDALEYLKFPKLLGKTKDGEDIIVNTGRFGEYLQVKNKYYNLKPNDEYNMYNISLETANNIIEKVDMEKANMIWLEFKKDDIKIMNGNYGPYIRQGKKIFKLPKDLSEENIRKLTLEEVKNIIKNQPTNTLKKFKKK